MHAATLSNLGQLRRALAGRAEEQSGKSKKGKEPDRGTIFQASSNDVTRLLSGADEDDEDMADILESELIDHGEEVPEEERIPSPAPTLREINLMESFFDFDAATIIESAGNIAAHGAVETQDNDSSEWTIDDVLSAAYV